MTYLPFLLLVLISLILAHWLKRYYEHFRYATWKYVLAIFVNGVFLCIYTSVAEMGCLVLWWCMDRWRDGYKIIEWAAIAAAMIHGVGMGFATLSKRKNDW